MTDNLLGVHGAAFRGDNERFRHLSQDSMSGSDDGCFEDLRQLKQARFNLRRSEFSTAAIN
jgi:hypothetical protein